MANAATAYRDIALQDRGDTSGFAAVLAYLEPAAPQPPRPQPPPLPPLAAVRQVSSHQASLPPVRNLLTPPEQWAAAKQNAGVNAPQQPTTTSPSNTGSMTADFEGEEFRALVGFQAPEKPLKRGPKGPRQKLVRKPAPLKQLAPKIVEMPQMELPPVVEVKPKKAPPKRSHKRKKEQLPPLDTSVSDESVASSLLTMNASTDIHLSQPFNDLQTMEPTMLAHSSVHQSQHGPFANLQHPPMDLHSSQPQQQPLMTTLYNSPQNNFSPVSEAGNPSFQQSMYHSPAFPTNSHTSSHVSPHSAISPLQSIHNSPHAFRAALDHIPDLGSPGHLSLTSPAQIFPQRLGTGASNSPNFVGVNAGFPSVDGGVMNASAAVGPGMGKRKRDVGLEKDGFLVEKKGNGKVRKGGMTAIQSVLNHDGDMIRRMDMTPPVETSYPTLQQQPTSHPRSLSPKHGRIPLPITPTSPNHIRAPNELNALQLLLPQGMSSTDMNDSYGGASTINDESQPRPFDLHNPNSLAMVLNSEDGSTPQLYDFQALDSTNGPQQDIIPSSTLRDVSGRLPVQSLLLPPLPGSAHSPSMQVMQIQPSLLDQTSDMQSMDLVDQRRLDHPSSANPANDPFDMRMNSQGQFDVSGNIQPSSWVDILLQPNTTSTFPTELTNPSSDPIFDQPRIAQVEQSAPQQQPPPARFDEPQIERETPRPAKKKIPPKSKQPAKRETEGPQSQVSGNQPETGRRKKRGKHARYVAAEGKNGEPDKTHIDVLVTVIQKNDGAQPGPPKTPTSRQYDPPSQPPPVEDVSLVANMSRNSLPSIETLQLVDTSGNPGQSSQDRGMLDGIQGMQVSTEQPPYDYLDFLGPEEWLIQTSGNQVGMQQVRYYPHDFQETSQPAPLPPIPEPSRKPSSPAQALPSVPPLAPRRGRKGRGNTKQVNGEEPKAGPFVCNYLNCTSRFQHYQHYKTHLASHQGIKPFKCRFDGCEQTFSQKGNLKAHQRKHTGEKPFICEECDKAFAQKGNLQTHKSVHTGLKPFVCLIDNCTSRYSQRGNLKVLSHIFFEANWEMHQNKFHTERIQELTLKLQNAAKGGPPLTEEERKVADHLKILYKYSNKGIKGRGKKLSKKVTVPTATAEPTVPAVPSAQASRMGTVPEQQSSFAAGQTLLPLPVTKPVPRRGIEGPSPFMGMTGPNSSWSRDVFIGTQVTEGHQANAGGGGHSSYLGLAGDTTTGTTLTNFTFGNMG